MNIDEELLDRYYQGRCTEEECKAVEEWIKPEVYDNYYLEPEGQLQQKLWNQIKNKITVKSHKLYYWTAAACIALICTVFSFVRLQQNTTIDLKLTKIETLKGQRTTVTLPDGTIVYLNAGSSLRYPERFQNTRRVELSGEAFFDVVKMPGKPFIIVGKNTETQVLGTSFNLVDRAGKRNLTVMTGRVAYQNIKTHQKIYVVPNERVEIKEDGGFEKTTVYAQKYAAWKEGKMLFDNNTLVEIAATLENWYGVKIKISNKHLAGEAFTGQFNKPELGDVLRTIGFALKFKYTYSGNNVEISPE